MLWREVMRRMHFAVLACLAGVACFSGPARADKFELSKDEQKLLELTNKEREKKKLSPLKPNPLLFKAARAHSANMARQEKMEHVLDGKGPGKRARAAASVFCPTAVRASILESSRSRCCRPGG